MTSQSSIKSSRTSHAKTPKELDLCIRLRRSRAEESGHNFNPAPSKLQSISSTRAPLRHSTSVSAPVNAPLNFKQTCRNVNVVFSPVTTRPGTCKTGGRREPADASKSILEATTSLWFCVISPRGSCSACFPAFWASTINFVMGKSGGGGVFLAATICRDALEEPLLLFFLALALGFFAAAFMAPSSVETTFSAFFDAALSCSEFILLTVARILFDPLSSFIIIQCSCRIPHFSRSMMLEHIETRWNSSSTPRFEPRRMPPKIHKEAIKQNHGIYCTSLEIPHDSTAYLLASAAYFPVQICPKFEYVLDFWDQSATDHHLQRLATPNNDFWSFASSQIRTREMGWKWICPPCRMDPPAGVMITRSSVRGGATLITDVMLLSGSNQTSWFLCIYMYISLFLHSSVIQELLWINVGIRSTNVAKSALTALASPVPMVTCGPQIQKNAARCLKPFWPMQWIWPPGDGAACCLLPLRNIFKINQEILRSWVDINKTNYWFYVQM